MSPAATDRRRVVVTFPVGQADRGVLLEELDGVADVTFLDGLADEQRTAAVREADVLLTWLWEREIRPDERDLVAGVRLVQLVIAGVDSLPFDQVPPSATIAGNVGAYAKPIAEHAVAMILAGAKRLFPRHAEMTRGEFHSFVPNRTVEGMVAGILGLGGIGSATARLLRSLGASVHAINTSGRTDEPVAFIGTLADLDRVLEAADALVVALPLSRHTRGLIGARELALMKPDAILVNVARAEIVDEQALYEHLRAHPDFFAGLDVWWNEPGPHGAFRTNVPFFELPNVIGSPHNSAIVPGILEEAARRAAANVARYLRGERPTGVVDRDDYTA
jgi:phosphoglycerate dehydrogenase-like enzyme